MHTESALEGGVPGAGPGGGGTAHTAPPSALVASPAPAAVLLVDLTDPAHRSVVYANTVAQQLAPRLPLPASLHAWVAAAGLHDLDGSPLSGGEHPVFALTPPQRVRGQAVVAARASDLGPAREPLWMMALPMVDAPRLEHLALVVLLPLHVGGAGEQRVEAAARGLQEAAVLATGLSFTMSDARASDEPLVWVNPAFTATTGYPAEEALGRNCRFLQGPGTDSCAVAEIRAALTAGTDVTTTLLNYRKDGTAFWNEVAISPIFGPSGELTHFVGIQTDVTSRVAADAERDRALAAERAARQEAERARARLALTAEATGRLVATLDVAECLRRLADLVIPQLADWVIVTTTDDRGDIQHVVTQHRDGREADMEHYLEVIRSVPRAGALLRSLTGGPDGRLVTDYLQGDQQSRRREVFTDPRVLEFTERMQTSSLVAVPMPGRRHADGVMILVRGPASPAHTGDDLTVARDLGRRAGLILDNARLYEAEHRIAETLQRSLLPVLPRIDRVTAAAAYQPGETLAAVGGDFYELMNLPDGAVGLAIGDIVGHDVLAAAAMGHLRGLLRACAFDTGGTSGAFEDPAEVLDRVDRLLDGLGLATIATALYARAEPVTPAAGAAAWRLSWSSAGHPPLMVRRPSGAVEVLDAAENLLLGVQVVTRTSACVLLEAGSIVLAYTDGLVERRGESLAVGLERLRAALAGAPAEVGEIVPHLLAELGSSDDDVALMAVRLT